MDRSPRVRAGVGVALGALVVALVPLAASAATPVHALEAPAPGPVSAPVTALTVSAVTRVSVAPGGVQAAGGSVAPSLSADARYVAFHSTAANLVPGDTNGVMDVFVVDLQTGEVELVSRSAAGGWGNGHSTYAHLSDDGRYVAFDSVASNLVSGDANGRRASVFVHDRLTGQTTLASVLADGTQPYESVLDDFAAGGRHVTFSHRATSRSGWAQTSLRDLDAVATTSLAPPDMSVAAVSGDGGAVAFLSSSLEYLPPGWLPVDPLSGLAPQAYVMDPVTRATELVTRSVVPGLTAACVLACAGAGGDQIDLTPSGRHVVHHSDLELLTGADADLGRDDVYVLDRRSGTTRLVTHVGDGFTGDSTAPRTSAAGDLVAFLSSENAQLGDTTPDVDLFVAHLGTEAVTRVETGLGQWAAKRVHALSADGRTLAFASTDASLVPGDTNVTTDVFIVRIGADDPPTPDPTSEPTLDPTPGPTLDPTGEPTPEPTPSESTSATSSPGGGDPPSPTDPATSAAPEPSGTTEPTTVAVTGPPDPPPSH